MMDKIGGTFPGSFRQAMPFKKFLQSLLSIPFKVPQCVIQIK